MARPLHPKLAERAQAVKSAHAHLSSTVPGFRSQPPREQFRQVQAHVKRGAATKSCS